MTINVTLPVDFADAGPWRSYELYTEGNSLVELLGNATVTEVDQDGGELNCYEIGDASNEVAAAAINEIEAHLIAGNGTGTLPQPEDYSCA